MPGHKAGAGAPPSGVELLGRAVYEADVSELGGFDYLYEASSGLRDAQQHAADLFGARRSWFLVNGATVGNIAAICATVGDGDALLVARESHRSVYAGIALSGARPIYLEPVDAAGADGRFGIDPATVADALARHPEIRAVHVTSPSAYGFAIDVEQVARSAAAHGVPLIVDEAHGTHFALHPRFPQPALACGADLVVHSPHKSLGALTQSALLHQLGDRVDGERVGRVLQMLQSSSPSAPLLISLGAALDEMAAHGTEQWGATLTLADELRGTLAARPGLALCGPELVAAGRISAFDPTKLVVDVSALGTTGFAAARWLRQEHRIHPESADLRRLIFSLTVGDSPESGAVLLGALDGLGTAGLGRGADEPVVSHWPAQSPELRLTPRAAGTRPSRAVALADAAGEVAAEMLVPYPPGVPLVVGGEVLSAELIATIAQLLEHGCRMVGLSDPTGATLRCVARP